MDSTLTIRFAPHSFALFGCLQSMFQTSQAICIATTPECEVLKTSAKFGKKPEAFFIKTRNKKWKNLFFTGFISKNKSLQFSLPPNKGRGK